MTGDSFLPCKSLIHDESYFFVGLKIIWDRLQRGTKLFCFTKKHSVPHTRLPVKDDKFINIVDDTKILIRISILCFT